MRDLHSVGALVFTVAGVWLFFDMLSSLSLHIPDNWRFCLPFFTVCFDSGHWTFAADIACALVFAGYCINLLDGHRLKVLRFPNKLLKLSKHDVTLIVCISFLIVLFILLVESLV